MIESKLILIDGHAELKRLYFPNSPIATPKGVVVTVIDNGWQSTEELILFLNTGKLSCKKENRVPKL